MRNQNHPKKDDIIYQPPQNAVFSLLFSIKDPSSKHVERENSETFCGCASLKISEIWGEMQEKIK